jgi:uncharacterized protein
MALLDVNALVALVWDSHIHHARIREWFATNALQGWETCPITESGFVRVSTNPKVLSSPIGVADARHVLAAQCAGLMVTGSYLTTCHSLTTTFRRSSVTVK